MKISVVIPVFNQFQLTERCLKSLLEHSSLIKNVYLIDNASQDQTPEVLKSIQGQFEQAGIHFQIFTNEKNVGFGRACNQGVREFFKGNDEYLVILNNDTWLMQGWDQALIQALLKYKVDVVGPYFYELPFSEQLDEIAKKFLASNQNKHRKHFVPILMCFTRSAAVRLASDSAGTLGGIFDERFFVTYEDTDLLHRMKMMNLKYLQTASCFIWHHSKGTRDHLPSGYEQQGLQLFQEKWGFDPRPQDHTFMAKLKKWYWKFLIH